MRSLTAASEDHDSETIESHSNKQSFHFHLNLGVSSHFFTHYHNNLIWSCWTSFFFIYSANTYLEIFYQQDTATLSQGHLPSLRNCCQAQCQPSSPSGWRAMLFLQDAIPFKVLTVASATQRVAGASALGCMWE